MGINCVLCFSFLAFVCLVEGCTQFKNPLFRESDHAEDDEAKSHHSTHVVVGEVMDKVTASDVPLADIDGVDAFSVKVKCIYKGDNIADTITVTGIGNLNGQIEGCPPADLKKGKVAILFLAPTSRQDTFQVEFQPNLVDEDGQVLDEYTMICNSPLKFVDPGYEYTCYESLTKEEGCVEYVEPAMPTTKVKPPITELPINKSNEVTTAKSIDTSDGGYVVNPGEGDDKDKKPGNENPGKSSGTDDGSSASTLATSSLLILVAAVVTIIL